MSERPSRDVPIVVMGVSGSGKTTIAREMARQWHYVFIEADELHSSIAVEKMASGHPLDDDDRLPWLRRVGERIRDERVLGHRTVTACSALRRLYRDVLRDYAPDVFFAELDGPIDVVRERMEAREHFMPMSLLESQYATLEPLEPDESGIIVDLSHERDQIVREIVDALKAPTT